jgi:hypothetical protein
MAEKSDTLTKARGVLERTLMNIARDLAEMEQDASAHTIEEMASQIAAIEALDRARTATDRYEPGYFRDK